MCVLSIFFLVETISLKFWLRPLSCHAQERRLLKLSLNKTLMVVKIYLTLIFHVISRNLRQLRDKGVSEEMDNNLAVESFTRAY